MNHRVNEIVSVERRWHYTFSIDYGIVIASNGCNYSLSSKTVDFVFLRKGERCSVDIYIDLYRVT